MSEYSSYDLDDAWEEGMRWGREAESKDIEQMSAKMHAMNDADHRVVMRVLQRVRDKNAQAE